MAQASSTSFILGQAFRFLKLAPPSSFDDDSDKARDAAQLYPVALRACLEAGDWSFASVVANLPQATLAATQDVDDDLPYAYQLPGDCVTIRRVGDGDVAWRIDKGELLRADQSGPLKIRYTATVDQEAKLPATFRLAVAARLASEMASYFGEAKSTVEYVDARYQALIKEALRADRTSASAERYDGQRPGCWWADEVTR